MNKMMAYKVITPNDTLYTFDEATAKEWVIARLENLAIGETVSCKTELMTLDELTEAQESEPIEEDSFVCYDCGFGDYYYVDERSCRMCGGPLI